jgi:YVTN family beta-propeller protein
MSRRIQFLPAGLALAGALLAMAPGTAQAGPKAYVGNFKDNTVSVIDTAGGNVVATIPVAAGPHGMAISADGGTVYVSGDGSSSLDVIDTASDRVTKTIEVGKTPNGVALTPDGKFLLVAVAGDNRLAIIDTATQDIAGSVAVPKPHTVSVEPSGKLAYVTSQEPGHFGLAVIDLDTRSVVRTVPLDKTPRDGEFGAGGKRFYFTEAGVAAVQVLDPTSDQIVADIQTGVSPHFVDLFDGSKLGLVTVQGPGELLLFDPDTNKAARSIAVGKQPHWATLSGDGKMAYVTNEGSNDVSVVDLDSGKATAIPVGQAPRKIVVQPAGKRAEAPGGAEVSIANFAFNPGVITIRPGGSVTWRNDDGSPHALSFMDGSPGPASLLPGEAFTRLFDRSGTYDYACSFHPYMTGKVIVADSNS